ncbi:MAG: baseplate J/gp47 family protein [Clostridium sp.]|nr:baseplate J/gp47 family protein [Clostridium sp.]
MQNQDLDTQTKETIIAQIRLKAKSYVPEWRFDENYPDIGTALALVYGDMLSRTARKFEQVFLKNRIAFLNELDAGLLPAAPAGGYVAFSLANEEVDGVELAAGTVVNAESEDDDVGVIHYRTQDDVYVSPSSLGALFHTFGEEDFIARLDRPGGEWAPCVLFDVKRENLQRHELYICHREALCIRGEGRIRLFFFLRGELALPEGILEALADPERAEFSYYTEEGYERFGCCRAETDSVLLVKEQDQPPFALTELEGREGYWIRCVIRSAEPFRDFGFSRLSIRSWSGRLEPDMIYANGVECGRKRYFPFGERITPFSEVYFGCQEALCKKGARIELGFNLDYVRIPLDFNGENDPIKWEWIMRRSDFRENPDYDLTIEEVIWEYYNGTGWARLFPDGRFSDAFLPNGNVNAQHRTITFYCPEDMEAMTVNSLNSFYVRARVIKVNNLFKTKGAYITPILEDTMFQYDYTGREVLPEGLVGVNSLETRNLSEAGPLREHAVCRPFTGTETNCHTLYLGFEQPLDYGPIKLLLQLKDNLDCPEQGLLWEYWGRNGWREVNLVDETRSFSKTGIVTLIGCKDFASRRMFGEEKYWLRISDVNNSYGAKARPAALPVLEGIFMNAVRIVGADRSNTEYFQMEIYQENTRFELPDQRIMEAEVYVNEVDALSRAQCRALLEQGRLRPVYGDAGILREAWVKWNRVEDFSDSGEGDRDYVLEPNQGYIIFGNGRSGRIPPSALSPNIMVEYTSGGGEHTNVETGRVAQLDQEIGFISQVRNPLPLSGGCDIEGMEEALARCSSRIRHQNRAVTVRDYEDIAREASRSIRRVKCFPGYDRQGRPSPGAVTLVLLLKDFEQGNTRFGFVKEQVEEYLKDKVSGDLLHTGKLAVVEPDFIRISLRAELTAEHFNAVFQVKKLAVKRLEEFLNPLTGNFNGRGWEIGTLPNNLQIKNAIADIPGLVYVRNIYISAFAGGPGGREVDLDALGSSPYCLPVGGRHEVIITVR